MKKIYFYIVFILVFSGACSRSTEPAANKRFAESVPVFTVDPFWPKPLPDNWLLGHVAGVAVDSKDHVWIIQRPGSLGEMETSRLSAEYYPYVAAPPVIEFDHEGNVVQAWGGPGEGFVWPQTEHGILIDHKDNVWINGGGEGNHQVLKFTRNGEFLLAIGKPGKTGGNNNTELLGFPTEFAVDSIANEVYIADGYLNNRVIVFDANTAEYKRHWGAYGKNPLDTYDPDNLGLEQFNTVHAVVISDDGMVYVADRGNNRIQVFEKDGTFIFEGFVANDTKAHGSAWDIDFSHDPEQTFIYLADGINQHVWIIKRETLKTVGHFGRMGRYAGQFIWLHSIAADSKSNIFTAEVFTGRRVQRFVRQ